MNILLFAISFLATCLGIAALAAIPFLLSLSRRNEELASSLNVNTQILINRYNALNSLKQDSKTPPPPPPKSKGTHLYQLNRDKHGDGQNDKDK